MEKVKFKLLLVAIAFTSCTLVFSSDDDMITKNIGSSPLLKQGAMSVEMREIGGQVLPAEFYNLQMKRAQKAATRFTKIDIDELTAKDEINFWAHQLSEHALFLHLGIEDKILKERALALHKQFEAFRNSLKEKSVSIKQMNKVLPLVKELRDYKIEVLTRLVNGEWIGWIFPLFARHIILESDYFVDKLQGIKYSDREEIAFWNIINGEHAAFAAHLLDPSEQKLSGAAEKMSKKFAKIITSEDDMMIEISLRAAKELDAYNRTADTGIAKNTISSVIHPALIKHVVREGQRSIQTLEKLADQSGAIFPEVTEAEI